MLCSVEKRRQLNQERRTVFVVTTLTFLQLGTIIWHEDGFCFVFLRNFVRVLAPTASIFLKNLYVRPLITHPDFNLK